MGKILNWRRPGKIPELEFDLLTAEYRDYRFLLRRIRKDFHRHRWLLEIYGKAGICWRTRHPNLEIAQEQAEKWLNERLGKTTKKRRSKDALRLSGGAAPGQ